MVAAQLCALSVSTADSVASTGSDAWRRMRPAFDADTLHYSVGCNSTDTMTLTMSPADTSSRISVNGTQHANPGAGTSLTATPAASGDSVGRIALADAEGAQTQYVLHCLADTLGELTIEKPLGEAKVLDELILFADGRRLVITDSNGVPCFFHRSGGLQVDFGWKVESEAGQDPAHRGPTLRPIWDRYPRPGPWAQPGRDRSEVGSSEAHSGPSPDQADSRQ